MESPWWDLTRQVKQQARALGVDLVGVAPVERFVMPAPCDEAKVWGYLPTGYAPTELLPRARSVIVLGLRQLTGVMESVVADAETTYPFGTFGYVHLNRTLNSISYALARWLEEQGWSTLPLGAALASRLDESKVSDPGGTGSVAPIYGIFSVKRAAVLAGLGRRAKNGLVATPQYGTQVRLGVVITAAPLDGGDLLEGSPCPPRCNICVNVCPMGAVSPQGRVDHLKCFADCGRRGTTYHEVVKHLRQRYPPADGHIDYTSHEHSAIDSFGNRLCRVACMALCPLGTHPSRSLRRRIRDWGQRHPKVIITSG